MSPSSLITFSQRLRLLNCAFTVLLVLTGSIVISLRNDMFELAHRLVGIYKTSNVSTRECVVC